MSKHKKQQAKKKVSIIIPFYGQTEKELAIPLSTINAQTGVDFAQIDVHLVNDGGEPIDVEKFAIFANLDLHYHELPENVGPGLARQYGIDHSVGEYVMFIDSDDGLIGFTALDHFFTANEQLGNREIIAASFTVQERAKDRKDKFVYFNFGAESDDIASVVFNKWFHREYLQRLGLRFHPQLTTFYEDTYFAWLAMNLTSDGITTTNQYTYMRRFNAKSYTHSAKMDVFQPLDQFVLMSRLRLEKVQEIKAAALTGYITSAFISIFLSYKKTKMTNEEEFWIELRKLLVEFPYDYKANYQLLESLTKTVSEKQGSYYQNGSADGLKEFLDKI